MICLLQNNAIIVIQLVLSMLIMKMLPDLKEDLLLKLIELVNQFGIAEITKKLQNTVIGKKEVVLNKYYLKNKYYPWGYQGKYDNMNGDKAGYYNVDE